MYKKQEDQVMKRILSALIMAILLSPIINVKLATAQSFLFSIPSDEPVLTGATGVVVAGNGNIYATLATVHQVVKLAPDGTELLTIGTLGFGNGQLNEPRDISVDSSGNMYVAERGNHRIQVFNSSGVFQFKFG